MAGQPLLSVRNLKTYFYTMEGVVKAVDGLSFDLSPGETLGIVGESGSGKTVAALSVLRLIPDPPGKILEGEVLYEGRDLLGLTEKEMHSIRGNEIAMIFQDPMTSLNPVFTVGYQIMEAIILHQKVDKKVARQRAIKLLAQVGIPRPEERINDYPYQFSGGMRQRVMIAMALSCNPKILIADEPTTALDVTIQAQILRLMNQIKHSTNFAIVIIPHDLGVIAEMADNIVIMYGGKAVEHSDEDSIFYRAHHPYTWGLLRSIPRLDETKRRRLVPIEGVTPSLIHVPSGCSFHPRCPYAREICFKVVPELREVGSFHKVACHLSEAEVRYYRETLVEKSAEGQRHVLKDK
ncbi:ABC transporter ATP-binding protein [Candidatus Hakubella thermalkaliphila]|uniref:Peptide/nickel transport system ATP-binding protein n=1 Tax=Candidatus Hakubella thermalkaliphila TaxID=2754717 RepID=A0A6V8P968_9ACTN|nr:ABC transporter ATP-binding protein [Candidatus Hakubella thermalkaliphila]GFP29199.1 peptide/nickel transport system ATP-binding protein [Candidatus Hakubella thermalkaliphila]